MYVIKDFGEISTRIKLVLLSYFVQQHLGLIMRRETNFAKLEKIAECIDQ